MDRRAQAAMRLHTLSLFFVDSGHSITWRQLDIKSARKARCQPQNANLSLNAGCQGCESLLVELSQLWTPRNKNSVSTTNRRAGMILSAPEGHRQWQHLSAMLCVTFNSLAISCKVLTYACMQMMPRCCVSMVDDGKHARVILLLALKQFHGWFERNDAIDTVWLNLVAYKTYGLLALPCAGWSSQKSNCTTLVRSYSYQGEPHFTKCHSSDFEHPVIQKTGANRLSNAAVLIVQRSCTDVSKNSMRFDPCDCSNHVAWYWVR